MSGSLCGPSNALQSLTKHTSVDRSLQRDRLAPNRNQAGTPLSGFRSASSHVNPQADHEFATFAGGTPTHSGSAFEHLQIAPPLQFTAHRQPVQDNWANDFQRLEIGPAQPILRPKNSSYLNTVPTFQTAGPTLQWRSEFSATRAESPTAFVTHSMMPTMQQTYNPGFSSFSQVTLHQSSSIPEQQHRVQDDFQFDESAFENAFEMAARQLDETAANELDVHGTDHGALAQAVSQAIPADEERLREQDSDELARTAGQLLDSVKSDSSEKFQKSNFLALMRRLRDHEVVIQGDTMVERSADGPAPAP